ncbi:hypothetical protein M514_02191 [Trichuris suis]|uniref:Uncharacterized protein n=1 Tax=Trichuris suis TaxID=68888 RepID=A0A085MI88_9BILA|nr:hypothetical protein M513_02191 [Trichuris suis]KFD66178.1 hypothetical protein M514_02191 [Trichuris suis]
MRASRAVGSACSKNVALAKADFAALNECSEVRDQTILPCVLVTDASKGRRRTARSEGWVFKSLTGHQCGGTTDGQEFTSDSRRNNE